MEKIRLNKYLAQCGVCSRRDADKIIGAGRVSVNGVTADMGVRVDGHDSVLLDGKELRAKEEKVVLAYYKPKGVTCTEKDRFAERIVTEEINYPVRVTYAGRLDKDSEGLLLLSNDGDLIQHMMKGSEGHEKEYVVRIKQEVTKEFMEKMSAGVYLKDLGVKTLPCRIEKRGRYLFYIVLTQGLNRQIRRMCKELGFGVVELKRVRVMNIRLGHLKVGAYRKVTDGEYKELLRLLSKSEEGMEE